MERACRKRYIKAGHCLLLEWALRTKGRLVLMLLVGLMLLLSGASGRIALMGARASAGLSAIGTALSVAGTVRVVRKSRPRPDDVEAIAAPVTNVYEC